MAITAKPYAHFLFDLGSGVHNLTSESIFVALLKNTYTPDYANHSTVTAFGANEIDAASGSYSTGGQPLVNRAFTYNASTSTATLTSDDITWPTLTATVRYAVVYSADNSTLLGLVDFGADRVYAGDPLELSFPNGVFTIGVVS